MATSKVSSPDVTKGQAELEYRGGYDIDGDAGRDGQEGHKFVANYGITDHWRTEVKAVAAGNSDDRDWTFLEWSNRLQLVKDGWAKLAVQENYKLSLQEGTPDELEAAVLASTDTGALAHTANLTLGWEVGEDSGSGTGLNLGWKTRYLYDAHFNPGVELYADFGKLGHDEPEKIFLGPVASGKVTGGLRYDAGLLFGLNDHVPDGRLKAILTHVF